MDGISPSFLARVSVRAATGAFTAASQFVSERKTNRAIDQYRFAEMTARRYVLPVLAEMKGKYGSSDIDRAAQFLQTRDAEAFLRSMSVSIVTERIDGDREALMSELAMLLQLLVGVPSDNSIPVSEILFRVLRSGLEGAIKELGSHSAAHREVYQKALSESNNRLLRDISKRASSSLSDRTLDTLRVALEFEKAYRSAVNRSTREITPAYYDIQRREPIEQIYVQPDLSSIARNFLRSEKRIPMPETGLSDWRWVVLGDPGAGKSTLLQYVAYQETSQIPDASERKPPSLTPILIPVRAYEARRRVDNCSIPAFICIRIKELYHLPVSEESIDYLLSSGRALVLFDGLDELIDIGLRREVCATVENFSEHYSNVPVIVTSRKVGYREAPLNAKMFGEYELSPFTDSEVRSYASAWFSLDKRSTENERKRIAESFLKESETINDIRCNPMMLGLLCNVYRNMRYIPQNRAELYDRCATMLFELWDAQRGIGHSGVLKADARAALQSVALWIFSSQEKDSVTQPPQGDGTPWVDLSVGVGKRLLLQRLRLFWARRFEHVEDQEEAAARLLELWTGRSWILTDTGTDPNRREAIYQFTHQTFLEYFAAIEIVRIDSTPRRLWDRLSARLRRGQWEIVSQLAIQRLESLRVDAGDEVLGLLLDDSQGGPLSERLNLTRFAIQNIDSFFMTSRTTRQLARATVDACLDCLPMPIRESELGEAVAVAATSTSRESFTPLYFELLDSFYEASCLSGEAGRVVRDEISSHLEKLILDTQDDVRAGQAFVFAAEFNSYLATTWKKPLEGLRSTLDGIPMERLQGLSSQGFWVAVCACRNGLLSPSETVSLSGLTAIFCGASPLTDRLHSSSVAENLLESYLGHSRGEANAFNWSDARAMLRDLASELEGASVRVWLDWIGSSSIIGRVAVGSSAAVDGDWDPQDTFFGDSEQYRREEDGRVSFSVAVLLATYIEEGFTSSLDLHWTETALRLGQLQYLEPVLKAKCVSTAEADVILADACPEWTAAQRSVLRRWMTLGRTLIVG